MDLCRSIRSVLTRFFSQDYLGDLGSGSGRALRLGVGFISQGQRKTMGAVRKKCCLKDLNGKTPRSGRIPIHFFHQLSGCLGDLLGMKSYTQLCGDYFINHEMRIPSFTNQDSMESKRVFCSWLLGASACQLWYTPSN